MKFFLSSRSLLQATLRGSEGRHRLLSGDLSVYDPATLGRGASVDVPPLEEALATVNTLLCAVVARYRASHTPATPGLASGGGLQCVVETHFLTSTDGGVRESGPSQVLSCFVRGRALSLLFQKPVPPPV